MHLSIDQATLQEALPRLLLLTVGDQRAEAAERQQRAGNRQADLQRAMSERAIQDART